MKTLSLCQPWAALVVAGAKRYETRSWQTAHRGPLAIHASARFPPAARALCRAEPFRLLLEQAGYLDWTCLPTRAVVGVVDLVACRLAVELSDLDPVERQLGDFGPGRWAWQLANPRRLATPIPGRGRLGVFDGPELPAEIVDLLRTSPLTPVSP
jgi:hypothetical protein